MKKVLNVQIVYVASSDEDYKRLLSAKAWLLEGAYEDTSIIKWFEMSEDDEDEPKK